jgi:ketosteroid isomerase-like protein
MKRNKLFKLVLPALVMLTVILSGSALAKPAATKQAPEAEFKALIDRYYAAWSSMNTDNASQFYAKDADLVFYDIAPLKYNNWAEYKEGVQKNFFDGATSAKLTPNSDLKVTRRGNVAWTVVTFHLSVKLKSGDSMEIDARHTAIWENRGGKWLIVHEHVSAPLPS